MEKLRFLRRKFTLKATLSLAVAFVSLLTIAIISLLSNYFIQDRFRGYLTKQQAAVIDEIIAEVGSQYDTKGAGWNAGTVHTIGMNALNDGYLIKVYDTDGNTVWDAETCDMKLCTEIMDKISHRMMTHSPQGEVQFTAQDYPIQADGKTIGTIQIGFYGPYFLNENDFEFLHSLNAVLVGVGIFSLAVSVLIGFFVAKRISSPILKTALVAKEISDGEYNVRLEETANIKEVNELTQSINLLADSLARQESLRKQLTADVAHELRTPLSTLQTHIEAMAEGVWEPTAERLQSCYDEAVRLGRLVRDLESLARADSENLKLEKTQFSLSELVNKVRMNFNTDLSNKNIGFSMTGTCPEVLADRDKMSQVVINLLSNALKYTPAGGEISVHLTETDKVVTLSVQDTGIGIPAEELPLVFERFYRADKSRNRSTGGTGIGLAIVKSIVKAHGGSVEAQSTLGKGSCFSVILPK